MTLLHHICIQTDDYRASLDFYTRVLDFEVVQETPGFHSRHYNTWLQLDGFLIELQTNKVGETLKDFSSDNKGLVHFCFYVRDLMAMYKRIRDLDYGFFKSKNGEDIYTVEGGQLFKVIAPEGTIIEFRDNKEL